MSITRLSADSTNELGTHKTVLVLAIVAGCFAILWPRIFYPMLIASFGKLPNIETSGCCDVIFENDVTAVDIMQELCHNFMEHYRIDHPRDNFGKNKAYSTEFCKQKVLETCGIDLSVFLTKEGKMTKSYRQVLEEIRSFNSSSCLKLKFGVPSVLPHLVRNHILMPHSSIRQERATPPIAGSFHPALRERGRAIPHSHIIPRVDEKPSITPVVPKMRPPIGGAGGVVQPPKGNGSMGIIMPLYTIGIIIFFLYTISKVLMGIVIPLYTFGNLLSFLNLVIQVLKKNIKDEEPPPSSYSVNSPERNFQNMVFDPELFHSAITAVSQKPPVVVKEQSTPETNEEQSITEKLVQEIHEVPKSDDLGGSVDGLSPESQDESKDAYVDEVQRELDGYVDAPAVQVMNVEVTASTQHGQTLSRPGTPILVRPHSQLSDNDCRPPTPIYLEGALPSQCELLVAESRTQELPELETEEAPVVVSGKMTLSLISLDQIPVESADNEENEKDSDNDEMEYNGDQEDDEIYEDTSSDESEEEDYESEINKDTKSSHFSDSENVELTGAKNDSNTKTKINSDQETRGDNVSTTEETDEDDEGSNESEVDVDEGDEEAEEEESDEESEEGSKEGSEEESEDEESEEESEEERYDENENNEACEVENADKSKYEDKG